MTDAEWKVVRLGDLEPSIQRSYGPRDNHKVLVGESFAETFLKRVQNDIFGSDYDCKLVSGLGLGVSPEGTVVVAKATDKMSKIMHRPVPILEPDNIVYVKVDGELVRYKLIAFDVGFGRLQVEKHEL